MGALRKLCEIFCCPQKAANFCHTGPLLHKSVHQTHVWLAILGEPSNLIFRIFWDFVPTRLTPNPTRPEVENHTRLTLHRCGGYINQYWTNFPPLFNFGYYDPLGQNCWPCQHLRLPLPHDHSHCLHPHPPHPHFPQKIRCLFCQLASSQNPENVSVWRGKKPTIKSSVSRHLCVG